MKVLSLKQLAKMTKVAAYYQQQCEVLARENAEQREDRQGDIELIESLREELKDACEQVNKLVHAGRVLTSLGYEFTNGIWVAPVAASGNPAEEGIQANIEPFDTIKPQTKWPYGFNFLLRHKSGREDFAKGFRSDGKVVITSGADLPDYLSLDWTVVDEREIDPQ